ncbi:MAG: glycosyltransferase family 2 protein [Endomicrobium sp.]|jgi:GT2 family glycosyltransferase|nr:glycosyltransferase family 2 protein [Endomicrobium sp.]
MNEMQVSVIFVNYNTEKMTVEAVKSVFDKTDGVDFEIIVVDNASADNSVNGLKKAFGNKITVIESKENLGFGRGNNLAINMANGKYVFLLNTDTLLINNAVKILFDFMEKNPEAGVCGANLYDAGGNPTYSFRKRFLPENELLLNNIFKAVKQRITKKIPDYFNYKNKNMRVDAVTGADMMIREEALDKSGLFDADFFMYLEEDELTSRIAKCGYLSYSVPEAKITHLVCGSFCGAENNEKRLTMHAYGEFLFYEKVYGIESAVKHYKKRLQFINILNVLSFGILRKYCALKKKALNEAYSEWKKRNLSV